MTAVPTVEIICGAATDTGPVRELNEDAVLAQAPLFAVADGMGGHAAGEVAAALALDTLARHAGRGGLQPEDLLSAIDACNAQIVAVAAQRPGTAGMGTTLAGAYLGSAAGTPHWFVFNVGDSRVYLLSRGVFEQVTIDHSEIAELLSAGEITPEEARVHPQRNVVTRSLGTEPAPDADLWLRPVEVGDTVLVCSDGLIGELPDDYLAAVLGRADGPQELARSLVGAAVAAGARDNVSAVVVRAVAAETTSAVDVPTAPRNQMSGGPT